MPPSTRDSDLTTSGRSNNSDVRQQLEYANTEDIQVNYEQSMFGLSSNGDRTLSHALTNIPAASEDQGSETGVTRDEGGSFYSYNSMRDVRLFVKEMHGRWATVGCS